MQRMGGQRSYAKSGKSRVICKEWEAGSRKEWEVKGQMQSTMKREKREYASHFYMHPEQCFIQKGNAHPQTCFKSPLKKYSFLTSSAHGN